MENIPRGGILGSSDSAGSGGSFAYVGGVGGVRNGGKFPSMSRVGSRGRFPRVVGVNRVVRVDIWGSWGTGGGEGTNSEGDNNEEGLGKHFLRLEKIEVKK